jgi:hypothetical protein
MESIPERERLVKAASAFLADTPLAPDAYEGQLLARFIAGELTIYQVLEMLAERQSQAAMSPSPVEPHK